MKLKVTLFLFCIQFLFADSWMLGLGTGSSHKLGTEYSTAPGLDYISVIQNGWRLEAEAGYYTGREGFDVIAVYGETFWRSASRQTLFRDQHLTLLGEYRLFVLTKNERLQFAPGLGPSLRRLSYYSEEEKVHYPLRFNLDAEFAGLFFATRHLLLRAQAVYSCPPRYPLFGTFSITLRMGYRT